MPLSSTMLNMQPKTAYELDFCNVYVYDYFLLSTIHEGVLLNKPKMLEIMKIAHDIFGNQIPFAYVSLRINSYSVDPTIYFTVRQIPNLKAFAIVSNKEIDYYNYKIETFFYKRNNMKIFFDKKSALTWINKTMGITS